MMDAIEPKIKPLVDALNETGVVRTFSSCEGHFGPNEQTLVDRNHAEVRFIPAEGVPIAEVETLLAYILTRYKNQHGIVPVNLRGFRLYTPIDEDAVEETFVVELRPFNRFDQPGQKRADIDRAIQQTARLVAHFRSSR